MAQVIVDKAGDGAELTEDSGLVFSVSFPGRKMKRNDAELVFSRLGYFRFHPWENLKFGWRADFIHENQPIPYVITKKGERMLTEISKRKGAGKK